MKLSDTKSAVESEGRQESGMFQLVQFLIHVCFMNIIKELLNVITRFFWSPQNHSDSSPIAKSLQFLSPH